MFALSLNRSGVGRGKMADVSPPPHWLAPVLTFVGSLLASGLLWAGQRIVGKAAFAQAVASQQNSINDGFAKLTQEMREELELERTLHLAERIESEKQRAALRGEIARLTQVVASLETVLRQNGLPIPPRRPPYSFDDPPPSAIEIGDQLAPR